MDQNVKTFYDYVRDVFGLETVYYWAVDVLRDISDKLKVNPLHNRPDQNFLDDKLSENAKVKIKSSSIGITDFDAAIIETTPILNELGIEGESNGYTLSYRVLKDQVLQFIGNKIKRRRKEFRNSGVRIPEYVIDVFAEVDQSCSAALQREFCSRIEASENTKELISACDIMKKTLAEKAAQARLDEDEDRKRKLSLLTSLFLINNIFNDGRR